MEKDNQVGVYSNKKNITLYSSKQEKEVENLTEQLRTVQAGTKPRTVLNIAGNVPKSQPLPLVNNHLTKLVLLLVSVLTRMGSEDYSQGNARLLPGKWKNLKFCFLFFNSMYVYLYKLLFYYKWLLFI